MFDKPTCNNISLRIFSVHIFLIIILDSRYSRFIVTKLHSVALDKVSAVIVNKFHVPSLYSPAVSHKQSCIQRPGFRELTDVSAIAVTVSRRQFNFSASLFAESQYATS